MNADGRTPFIRAEGDSFELGYRHGRARAAELRAFLGDGLCRLNRILPEPVSLAGLGPEIDAYTAEIAAATPDLAEEIRGLGAGAELDAREAALLQLRREILGYQKIPSAGDCTTYALAGADPVLAQTVDLNGDLDDQISVLEIARAGASRRVLVLSFGGLLGYLGLNSDGLAVGLNLVLGGDWKPGVPPYLAIRHVLDKAGSVAEAVRLLRELPLASSRNIVLCDRDTAAWVEVLGPDVRVEYGRNVAHTNHFLAPDLASRDEINVFARNSSVRRLEACRARLVTVASDPEEHLAVLSAPPINVSGNGDIRRERTVAAVVLCPERGRMYLRPGDPAAHATEIFALS
ncbi:C45 family autoproteolytic acyltransferase/hydolase [Nocardia pseudobrasiliensis]|uniref:Acyl-CoA:6-aminopenicillanic acid acyl transferase n=1 Tax=Nocardia pseudobrasiliensis TaxID=45979 RepID=A0A370ID45_9NOCA|nr:C45 family peptidase [Nocardia pseudobrasiliensis]RDI68638.1 acyl-CoA:6-aminopenicillanic acid acyl transferase [Nocardia pseudobrasiliensis]